MCATDSCFLGSCGDKVQDLCVPKSCEADVNCQGDAVCVGGACASGRIAMVADGCPCDWSLECASGDCNGDFGDAYCAVTATERCEPNTCDADATCEGDDVCVGGACAAGRAAAVEDGCPCDWSVECKSGSCLGDFGDAYCAETVTERCVEDTCAADATCEGDDVCVGGACAAGRDGMVEDGCPCEWSVECASGKCEGWIDPKCAGGVQVLVSNEGEDNKGQGDDTQAEVNNDDEKDKDTTKEGTSSGALFGKRGTLSGAAALSVISLVLMKVLG